MNPLWTLAPVGILSGAVILWSFRRIGNPRAIHLAVNRIEACVLEFLLFVGEPQELWKSWKGLLAANGRLLRLLAVPFLALGLATLPLVFFLDELYGSSQLPVGLPAVVTMAFDRPLEEISPLPRLQAPTGILVESPAVRVFSDRQVSWRIRPLRPFSGRLVWSESPRKLAKSVNAGYGFAFHSPRRVRGLLALLRYPAEAPLPSGHVDWIEVSYPETHWSLWFLAFSLTGMLLARRTPVLLWFERPI